MLPFMDIFGSTLHRDDISFLLQNIDNTYIKLVKVHPKNLTYFCHCAKRMLIKFRNA